MQPASAPPTNKVAYVPKSERSVGSSSASPSSIDDQRVVEFFDSHCHLELILDREGVRAKDGRALSAYGEENFFRSDSIKDLVVRESSSSSDSADDTSSRNRRQRGAKAKAPPKGWIESSSVRSIRLSFGGCIHVCCFAAAFDPTDAFMRENVHEGVYASYGIHPHAASEYTDEIEARIARAMEHPKTVAWGECGLDYFKNFSPHDVQRDVFERQMRKAVELDKPIVIHSRDADDDTLRLMREHLPRERRIHMHCFGSDAAFAQTLMSEWPNLFVGFTGAITFGNAQRNRAVVKVVPLDRLLLETDGPFMAPVPHRGKVAHPGMIPLVANKVAEIKEESLEHVITTTRENVRRMYGV